MRALGDVTLAEEIAELETLVALSPGLPLSRAALAYASAAHDGQRRDSDGDPFIVHPVEVAAILAAAGRHDEVVAAGLLHDTLEKTAVSAQELRHAFGATVTSLVEAVTEDPGIERYDARKAKLVVQVANAGEDAALVFAADKLSKTRELARRLGATQTSWLSPATNAKVTHYRDSLRMLERVVPGQPLVLELADQVHALPV